jgi:hypothetical protein
MASLPFAPYENLRSATAVKTASPLVIDSQKAGSLSTIYPIPGDWNACLRLKRHSGEADLSGRALEIHKKGFPGSIPKTLCFAGGPLRNQTSNLLMRGPKKGSAALLQDYLIL